MTCTPTTASSATVRLPVMPDDMMHVTMLKILHARFAVWLDLNGLLLVQLPEDQGTNNYVVVPNPARTDMYPPVGEGES